MRDFPNMISGGYDMDTTYYYQRAKRFFRHNWIKILVASIIAAALVLWWVIASRENYLYLPPYGGIRNDIDLSNTTPGENKEATIMRNKLFSQRVIPRVYNTKTSPIGTRRMGVNGLIKDQLTKYK